MTGQQHDLAIVNGRVVLPDGVAAATVVVDGGTISAILPAAAEVAAAEIHDATDRYVLPGLIDSHVHFRTPGLTHKEDWAHGSRAAAAGGVTTVLDMPNTRPALTDPADVARRADLIAGTSLVDFRFHLGASPARLDELRTLDERDAVSVKIFMAGHHTAPDVMRDHADLEKAFAIAAERGIRLVLHAEDDAVFSLLDATRAAPAAYGDYEPSRPRSGGIVAVSRVIELVRRYGAAAHILHVSSAEEVELLAAAARAGLPVTFEVTAHHLSFTAADTRRLGARIRLSPAIRQSGDQDTLWSALVAGEVSTVGSDHAPHTIAEKSLPAAEAPPGIPGVQELAIAVLTGLRRRYPDVPLDRHLALLVRVLSTRPAELFAIEHRKGSVEVGKDADLVVLDPTATWMLAQPDIHTKAGWSAYEGWTMSGRVETTYRRGQAIWDMRTGPRFGEHNGQWLDAAPRFREVPHVSDLR